MLEAIILNFFNRNAPLTKREKPSRGIYLFRSKLNEQIILAIPILACGKLQF